MTSVFLAILSYHDQEVTHQLCPKLTGHRVCAFLSFLLNVVILIEGLPIDQSVVGDDDGGAVALVDCGDGVVDDGFDVGDSADAMGSARNQLHYS